MKHITQILNFLYGLGAIVSFAYLVILSLFVLEPTLTDVVNSIIAATVIIIWYLMKKKDCDAQ